MEEKIKKLLEENNMEKYKPLVDKLLEEFKSVLERSYDQDDGHGLEHVMGVVQRALRGNDILNLGLNPKEIIVAGLFHDIFSKTNREDHHIKGHDYIINSSDLEVFEDIDIVRVARAILEHRASDSKKYVSLYALDHDKKPFKLKDDQKYFDSLLSELIASCDNEPLVLQDIVERCYKYTVSKHKDSDCVVIEDKVKKHIQEKFSRDGYLKFPYMFTVLSEKPLEEFYNEVDDFVSGKTHVIINHNNKKIAIGGN